MVSEDNTKPLLTVMICAYNQEQFIREAVEGAFAQTYSPLEILLSDDCSQDRTFEIMREMAEAYRGPHRLILNRNAINLGLAGHSNRMVQLSHGQLLVGAAGDDVCLPNRAEIIYQAWERSGRRATGIQSGFINIDENGNLIGDPTDSIAVETVTFKEEKPILENYVRTLQPGIVGGAFACHPVIYSTFGPLPSALIHEDNVVALRALCLGSLMFVNIPLIKRRFHGNNLFSRRHELAATWDAVNQQENRMIRDAKNRQVMYDAFLSDLQVAREKKLISDEQWDRIKNACLHRRRLFGYQAKYAKATLARKFQILFSAWRVRGGRKLIKWMLLRLIPQTLFRSLKVVVNSARLTLKTGFQSATAGKLAKPA